jgi:lipoprotein-anchoring transpeptidase ErfK/SrfK
VRPRGLYGIMRMMWLRAWIVALALALSATACGPSASPGHASPAGSVSPPAATASPGVATPVASPTPTPARDRPSGTVAVSRDRYLPMWKRPRSGGPDFVFDARGPTGTGIAPMLVRERRTRHGERWVGILLPIRPNGATAWAHSDDVNLIPRNEEIVVDLSERVLRDYVNHRLVHRFRVGVGLPQYPTGVGTFYVWQRVPFSNPYQPYGIFALGLSGFSPVLSDWPGGGRMAIHGTPDAADRGRRVSHGCIRVYNEDMRQLLDVRLGTPVIIRR